MAFTQTPSDSLVRDVSSHTSRPQHGDVMISTRTSPGAGFELCQWPDTAQYIVAHRDAAAHVAHRFDEHHGLDVWWDEGPYTLLASFRRATR